MLNFKSAVRRQGEVAQAMGPMSSLAALRPRKKADESDDVSADNICRSSHITSTDVKLLVQLARGGGAQVNAFVGNLQLFVSTERGSR